MRVITSNLTPLLAILEGHRVPYLFSLFRKGKEKVMLLNLPNPSIYLSRTYVGTQY